jgi:hypothetical protein
MCANVGHKCKRRAHTFGRRRRNEWRSLVHSQFRESRRRRWNQVCCEHVLHSVRYTHRHTHTHTHTHTHVHIHTLASTARCTYTENATAITFVVGKRVEHTDVQIVEDSLASPKVACQAPPVLISGDHRLAASAGKVACSVTVVVARPKVTGRVRAQSRHLGHNEPGLGVPISVKCFDVGSFLRQWSNLDIFQL